MAKGRRSGGYAQAPWCQLDANLADELAEIAAWAYGGMRSNAARSCVTVALHLAPHIRAGKGGEPPAAKITAKALAEETGTNASTVSRALRRLEGAGFLSATPDSTGGATSYTFRCHFPEAERPKVATPEAAPKAPREETRKPWENPDGTFRELSAKEEYSMPDRDIYAYREAKFRRKLNGGATGPRLIRRNLRGEIIAEEQG